MKINIIDDFVHIEQTEDVCEEHSRKCKFTMHKNDVDSLFVYRDYANINLFILAINYHSLDGIFVYTKSREDYIEARIAAMDFMENKYRKLKENKMKIEIYSKNGCDYCERAKNILNLRKIEYIEHKLSDTITKEIIQERVGDIKKINVVPQIFINDSYLGGYIDLIEFLAKDKTI